MNKVVGYVRVSTGEQSESGLGMEAQRAAITAEVERRGWELVGIFEDAGISGKALSGRPGLQGALSAVRSTEGSALVVAKLDRLSRSLLDFAALMQQSQREGWGLLALDLGVDTSTPSGEMMANVMATFAQFERRIISQRTKDALAVKKAEGVKLGRQVRTDPQIVSLVHQMREDGGTLKAIAGHLNESQVPTSHGGKCWYPSTVRSLLLATA